MRPLLPALWVAVLMGVAAQSCTPDASLVALTVTAGREACTLSPAFDPAHTTYSCHMPAVEHDIVITPITSDIYAQTHVRSPYMRMLNRCGME
jgi:hypothetical protein